MNPSIWVQVESFNLKSISLTANSCLKSIWDIDCLQSRRSPSALTTKCLSKATIDWGWWKPIHSTRYHQSRTFPKPQALHRICLGVIHRPNGNYIRFSSLCSLLSGCAPLAFRRGLRHSKRLDSSRYPITIKEDRTHSQMNKCSHRQTNDSLPIVGTSHWTALTSFFPIFGIVADHSATIDHHSRYASPRSSV